MLEFNQNASAARHARAVAERTQSLLLAVTGAETAQRGFLLTSDGAYLAPYLSARQNIAKALDELTQMDVEHADVTANLRSLIEDKMQELAQTVGIFQQGRAADALANRTPPPQLPSPLRT